MNTLSLLCFILLGVFIQLGHANLPKVRNLNVSNVEAVTASLNWQPAAGNSNSDIHEYEIRIYRESREGCAPSGNGKKQMYTRRVESHRRSATIYVYPYTKCTAEVVMVSNNQVFGETEQMIFETKPLGGSVAVQGCEYNKGNDSLCREWASQWNPSECIKNPGHMLIGCKKSCSLYTGCNFNTSSFQLKALSSPSTTSSSVFVTWSPPPCDVWGAPFRSYIIIVTKLHNGGTVNSTDLDNINQRELNVTGLQPYTRYRIYGHFVTNYRTSHDKFIDIKTSHGKPNKPTDFKWTSWSWNRLEWLRPHYVYGELKGFEIRYRLISLCGCDNSTGNEMTRNTSASLNTTQYWYREVLPDLFPGSRYLVRIAAINGWGRGDFQGWRGWTAPQAPDSPSNLTGSLLNGTAAKFAWRGPECQKFRGTDHRYYYEVEVTKSSLAQSLGFGHTYEENVVVSGVKPGQTYTLKVFTMNNGKMNSNWETRDITLAELEPGKPTNFSMGNHTDSSVFVTWEEPSNPNGVIMGYNVECKDHSGSLLMGKRNYSSNVFSHTERGLNPATEYICYVRANNAKGFGDKSEAVVYTKPQETSLQEPEILASTDTTFKMSFQKAESPLVKYYLVLVEPAPGKARRKRQSAQRQQLLSRFSPGTYVTLNISNGNALENIVIGDNTTSAGYWNKPLTPNDNYTLHIAAAAVFRDSVVFSVASLGKFFVASTSFLNQPVNTSDEPSLNIAVIAGSIAAVVLVVALAVILVLRRQGILRKARQQDWNHAEDQDITTLENTAANASYGEVPLMAVAPDITNNNTPPEALKSSTSIKENELSLTPKPGSTRSSTKGTKPLIKPKPVGSVKPNISSPKPVYQSVQENAEASEASTSQPPPPPKSEESVGPIYANTCTVESFSFKPPELPEDNGILITDLVDHVRRYRDNNNALFQEEYQTLPTDLIKDVTIGLADGNKPCNRYRDIVPYDETRVILKDQARDYINASYIVGLSPDQRYIATQAPNKSSLTDFLALLWQEKVGVVVMLSNVVELGKIRCELYWSEEDKGPLQCQPFTVTLETTEKEKHFLIRHLVLTKEGSDEKLHVKQYHYTSWPDFGVPALTSGIVELRNFIRDKHGSQLLLVHCSAGVGRTGSFMTLDMLLDRKERLPVWQTVNILKLQRPKMVQSLAQYMFLHDALLETLVGGETTFGCSEFPDWVASDAFISQITAHHKVLGAMVPSQPYYELERPALLSGMYTEDFTVTVKLDVIGIGGPESELNLKVVDGAVDLTSEEFWKAVMRQRFTEVALVWDANKPFSSWCPDEGEQRVLGSLVLECLATSRHVSGVTETKLQVSTGNHNEQLYANVAAAMESRMVRVLEVGSDVSAISALVQNLILGRNALLVPVSRVSAGVVAIGTAAISRVLPLQEVDVYFAAKMVVMGLPELMPSEDNFRKIHQIVAKYLESNLEYANFR